MPSSLRGPWRKCPKWTYRGCGSASGAILSVPMASPTLSSANPTDVVVVVLIVDVDGAETAIITEEVLGSDGALEAGEGMGAILASDPVLGGGAQQQQEPFQSPTKYPTKVPAATKSSPREEPMNNPTDASSPALEQPPTVQPTKVSF